MIVTPLIGSIILFWMIDSRGIVGNFLQILFEDPDLSLKASTFLTWIMLIVYGVWHAIPFSFIVFYAGLQTLPKDQIESAKIDGANRINQIIYVTIPHLKPTMITLLILSMGSFLSAGFDQIYNMYNPLVYDVADIIDTYVLRMLTCLLYTSPSPRDRQKSRMPSSA